MSHRDRRAQFIAKNAPIPKVPRQPAEPIAPLTPWWLYAIGTPENTHLQVALDISEKLNRPK